VRTCTPVAGAHTDGAEGVFLFTTARTKEEMRACLSHLTRFAQQRNLNKDWPVFLRISFNLSNADYTTKWIALGLSFQELKGLHRRPTAHWRSGTSPADVQSAIS
jgi:hypothetical protein